MFNIKLLIFLLLHLCISAHGNVFGIMESLVSNNVSVLKYVAFNVEDHNRVCIIFQLHSKLIINDIRSNISEEIIFWPNSSVNGNCTGVYRDLTIRSGPIQVRLVWEREPDPYEHGEVGWSSVGAPANTTSGTYALTLINITLPISLFDKVSGRDHLVHLLNVDHERFKTRSGDHYVCDTKLDFELNFLNTTMATPSHNDFRVVFEMDNSKMQAFSDVNVSDFTGTGQMCHQDLPSDSGVSIGIGVAVAVLVFAVLAFLAIGRLKEKDQQYQELDAGKWAATRT